jgi:ubiquinone/menaquinone biosynthesis C-methylase UbiE
VTTEPGDEPVDRHGTAGAPAADVAVSDEHVATRDAFERDDVVQFYATFREDLLPGEVHVFKQAVPQGARVLDLGVGAGRTTPFLAERASRYVGLDYSEGMLVECRRRFPDLEFVQADASDLSQFPDASFDVVVFSFNGIDCLHPDAVRLRCIAEIRRVLAPGGTAVISEHNPRAILVPPRPMRGVPPKVAVARALKAVRATVSRTVALVPTTMFRKGIGYYFDPEHGGNWFHAAVPDQVVEEWQREGFEHRGEVVGYDHPVRARALRTGWYYYTFQKRS